VSKRAILARYLGTDPSWPAAAVPRELTVADIAARARGGEQRARETLEETACYLGRGLATVIKAYDPRRIYLEGEITVAWALIEETVRGVLREQALIAGTGATEILTVSLGDHPRLRGAAALVSTPAFAAPIVA
jgi:predicted NBD/HSP70 family sugar kinase